MTNQLYGVHYFKTTSPDTYEPDNSQLYFFKSYIGEHEIKVENGDCVYYLSEDLKWAHVQKGPCHLQSKHLATVIRGYMHPDATYSLDGVTTLPYVNGCSTKQIFPPIRPGDPTLQFLRVPPFSKEQDHHIHSTYRVVLILEGRGHSIVGLKEKHESTTLEPGTVCVFEPMSPHHFETNGDRPLVALPLHVFSAVGPQEKNHPMFNGTITI